jgi:hypothetical protein
MKRGARDGPTENAPEISEQVKGSAIFRYFNFSWEPKNDHVGQLRTVLPSYGLNEASNVWSFMVTVLSKCED